MKILFFSPNADIWVHSFPEALIAEALRDAGHEVRFVGCGGALQALCVSISAHGVKAADPATERLKVCARCQARDVTLRAHLQLEGPLLADVVPQAVIAGLAATIEALHPSELSVFAIDGVEIGNLALYQLLIRTKRLSTDFTLAELIEYRAEILSTAIAYVGMRHLIENERPDAVVVYNALYPPHRAACKAAEAKSIPHYFMHASGNLAERLQSLWLGKGDTFSFFPHLVAQWPSHAEEPCSAEEVDAITRHFLELLKAQSPFVYSSPKSRDYQNPREIFGASEDQRLLLATLGSYDEERAAEFVGARIHEKPPLFETQVEWIQALIRFMEKRPDLFLVVRVHPREFPNKRDSVTSHHAQQLKKAFDHLPANVVVNWPDQGLSLYDLLDGTDVILNSWSSVGKEAALLGVPSVLYAPQLAFYPADLGFKGDTEEAYFAAIEDALTEGWTFERARRAFRWHAFEFIRAAVSVAESFPKKEGAARPIQQRIVQQIDRRIRQGFEQQWDCARRRHGSPSRQLLAAFFESGAKSLIDIRQAERDRSLKRETELVAQALRRIVDQLYSGDAARRSSRLHARISSLPLQAS